ncbi:MAG: methionine adenosyltransferase [Candidatus Woesearchaeota archaeon]
MNIIIEGWKKPKQIVEMVECKGMGHPDTVCDDLCESCSRALSKFYRLRFGKVLHHNIDKAVLIAGKSSPKFNGGEIIEPMKVILVGRATSKTGNIVIPIKEICHKAAEKHLKDKLGLKKFRLDIEVKEGASNLKQVMKKAVANDTSIGVAHYPLTELEKVVKKASEYLGSDEFLVNHKYVGKDIKIMGLRVSNRITLTVAIAFIGKHVKSMADYKKAKKDVRLLLEKKTKAEVNINTLDSYEDEGSIYLTVTGLSAEMGDDGNAGRGNRYDRLITPNQSMSMESYAGKNVNHPGKLYQVLSYRIAKKLVEDLKIGNAEVKLLTKIGKPLDEPEIVSITVEEECSEDKVREIVEGIFKDIPSIQRELVLGG